jgi:glutathione S-transferase/RNA polymerase-associated protein
MLYSSMMVILYEHPLSPFAQKVKIALAEKDVTYESRMPDLFAGGDAEFVKANPRQEVPALVVSDQAAIFDSTIILEYIEDRWPQPPLLPSLPADRARARMIEEVCDTYYEAINWAVFEVTVFGRATGDLAAKLLTRAAEQTAGANAYLERQLGSAPYFNGETFGWADLCVAPFVSAAAMTGRPPTPKSRLAAWLDRTGARPSVAQVMKQATDSLSSGMESIAQLISSGQFVREYRDHRLEWMMRSGGAEIVREGMEKKNIRFSHDLE